MLKDVILVNNEVSLDLKDKEGNVLRSIAHFGVHTKKLDLLFFKGRTEVEVAEIDFDKFAEELVSHYGENNFKDYVVEKETVNLDEVNMWVNKNMLNRMGTENKVWQRGTFVIDYDFSKGVFYLTSPTGTVKTISFEEAKEIIEYSPIKSEEETKEDLKRNLVDNLEQVKTQIASVTEELNKEKTKLEKELRSILDNEFVGEGTVFAYGSSVTYALYSRETKTLNKEKLTEFLALNGKTLEDFEDTKSSMVMNNYKTGSK